MLPPNFALLWQRIAAAVPDRPAVVTGDRQTSFAELERRAGQFAAWAAASGVSPGRTIAIAADPPELIEATFGTMSLGAVPLTIDARADADDLHRLIDADDAVILVHVPASAHDAARAAKRIQRRWRPVLLQTGDPYEHALAAATPTLDAPRAPAHDDLVLVGPPPRSGARATRWRNGDLLAELWARAYGDSTTESDPVDIARAGTRSPLIVLAPAAHGAGLYSTLLALCEGRTVVLPSRPGDPDPDFLAQYPGARVIDGHNAQPAPTDTALAQERVAVTSGGSVRLDDVEQKIRKHASVDDCAVVALRDVRGYVALVALVEVAEQHHLDAAELHAWSAGKLAPSEQPRAWWLVEKLERSGDATVDDERFRALVRASIRKRSD